MVSGPKESRLKGDKLKEARSKQDKKAQDVLRMGLGSEETRGGLM